MEKKKETSIILDGYTANDTKYKFGDNQDPNSAAVAFSPNISLPQFELTYYKVNYRNAVTTSGTVIYYTNLSNRNNRQKKKH